LNDKFLFRLNLADTLRLTMFGTIIAVTNDVLRLPLHMPGHTSIWWMGILLVGKGLIRKFGSGTVMGIVSGILAAALGLGSQGVLVFFKYLIPGVLLDFLSPFFANKIENPVIGGICGAFASLSKMAVNIILGAILKVPTIFLTLGIGFTAVSHVLYGAAGGVLATFVVKRLRPRLLNWE
jgi:hypothetical protein